MIRQRRAVSSAAVRFAAFTFAGLVAGPVAAQTAAAVVPNNAVPSNFEAIKQRAAAGDAMAQFQLGKLAEESARQLEGSSAQERYRDAARWYRAASDRGNADAMNNLGAMLIDGAGVISDPIEAASYYRRAAQAGSVEAKTNLAMLILRKRVVGTPEEALALLERAASAGFAPAQAQLAQIYRDGVLVAPNDGKALELFRKSALQQYGWGEYGYALMLQSGLGGPRDLASAEGLMERAANAGIAEALFDLSRMLDLGLGTVVDKKRAAALLRRAAALGEPRAVDRLRRLSPPAPSRPAS